MTQPKMVVSSAENLSLPYFDEHFKDEFELKFLPELDVVFPLIKNLAELKIGDDIRDIQRYMDELTRSNYDKYKGWIRHVIWIERFPDLKTFKWAVAFCQKAGLYFHHCYFMETQPKGTPDYTSSWVSKIKQIRRGEYNKPLQAHRKPSKHLTDRARMFAIRGGISEDVSAEIDKNLTEVGIVSWMQMGIDDGRTPHKIIVSDKTKRIICDTIGYKKGGAPLKKAVDFIRFLEEGK